MLLLFVAQSAGCESPGISYVSQKVEAGAGIGLWKENKGKKKLAEREIQRNDGIQK